MASSANTANDYLDAMSPNSWLLLQFEQEFEGGGNGHFNYADLDDFDVFDHDLLLEQINKDTNDNFLDIKQQPKYPCRCGREFFTKVAVIACSASHEDMPIKDSMILNGEKIYACLMCSYNTNNYTSLEKHKVIHANSKAFRCAECPYSTQFLHVLEHHKSGHTTSRKYTCGRCSYSCNLKEALRRHRAIHTLTKPFSCNLCNFKSVLKDVVVRHKATHETSRGYTCEQCHFQCKNLATYNKHTISHLPFPVNLAITEVKYPKPHQCKYCNMAFSRVDSLSVHVRKHTRQNPYCCEECAYTCKDRYALKKHVKLTHKGASPINCDLCCYSTYYKGDLKKHKLIHTGERKFKCDHCPFMGLLPGDLRRHMLTHTGVKSYKCQQCTYICSRSDSLKNHIQMHTKPFSCDRCGYRSTQMRYLKSHLMSHTGEKPFSCLKCDYRTRTSKHLQRHVKLNCKGKRAPQVVSEEDTEKEIINEMPFHELPLNEQFSYELATLDSQQGVSCNQMFDDDSVLDENEFKTHMVKEAITKLMDEETDEEENQETVNEEITEFTGNNATEINGDYENYDATSQEFIDLLENDMESRQIVAEEIMKMFIEKTKANSTDEWMNMEMLRILSDGGLQDDNTITMHGVGGDSSVTMCNVTLNKEYYQTFIHEQNVTPDMQLHTAPFIMG